MTEHVPVIPGFLRPIDTDAIARQLKLPKRGEERGADELPRADENYLDVVEQGVIQKIHSEWTWQGDALIKILRAYADRLVGFSVSAAAAELRLTIQNARARFLNASVQAAGELGPLRESFVAAQNDLRRFQAKNRIERPPHDPARRWTTLGFVVVLVGIESVLNGLFFAEGMASGLIGGIRTAIGISTVNVMFAYLLGLVPARFINYRNIFIRLFAFVVTVSGIALLILLHAFAVHFRDAFAVLSERAIADVPERRALEVAVQTLLHTPWSIHSLSSAYLFGLGILFAIGAFWKGYRFDDPFPF